MDYEAKILILVCIFLIILISTVAFYITDKNSTGMKVSFVALIIIGGTLKYMTDTSVKESIKYHDKKNEKLGPIWINGKNIRS